MNKTLKIILFVMILSMAGINDSHSQGSLDPVRLGTWVVNAGVGPGASYFGNGTGLGIAVKASVETGLWDLGPGVITLGGETAFSFFNHHYGEGWNESWVNFVIGARAAYHYGWDVEGLDTYGGIPLGIGFSLYNVDFSPGSSGSTPVYPYAGFFFGTSYFFTKSFGINGEVGYNATYANIGVVFKLK